MERIFPQAFVGFYGFSEGLRLKSCARNHTRDEKKKKKKSFSTTVVPSR